jgi:hypothetical protein
MSNATKTADAPDIPLHVALTVVMERAAPGAIREARARTRESLRTLANSRYPQQYGMRPGVVGETPDTRRRSGVRCPLSHRDRLRQRTEAALMVEHLIEIEMEFEQEQQRAMEEVCAGFNLRDMAGNIYPSIKALFGKAKPQPEPELLGVDFIVT